ncbi:MAG: alpha/beta fold hydrolase [Nitrososphaeraceae archaeon]
MFAISVSILSESTLHLYTTVTEVYAQPSVQTVKHRELYIDLGNGLMTNAQLTVPAVGVGPFPGVLLIPGSGAIDLNGTVGNILVDNKTGSKIYPSAQSYFQIAEYLSERGFAVLRYDKRGVGSNLTILDADVWGNVTFDHLKEDAERALSVLLEQPEVNATKKATLIAHSEGTMVAPRIAIEDPNKVKNMILMGVVAQNLIKDILYSQVVETPLFYAEKVLDKSNQGKLSTKEASEDPVFQQMVGGNLTSLLLDQPHFVDDGFVDIERDLKPILLTSYNAWFDQGDDSKCLKITGCPLWVKSHFVMNNTLSMIGNIPSSASVLILQGENDSQTPVEQGLLLQQRLAEVNHPDHLIITYPGLGHLFSPTNRWVLSPGPIEEYVLQDMFEWLASPVRDVSEEMRRNRA